MCTYIYIGLHGIIGLVLLQFLPREGNNIIYFVYPCITIKRLMVNLRVALCLSHRPKD